MAFLLSIIVKIPLDIVLWGNDEVIGYWDVVVVILFLVLVSALVLSGIDAIYSLWAN